MQGFECEGQRESFGASNCCTRTQQNSCLVPKLRNFTAKITLCVARAGVLLLEYCCCLKTCAAGTLSVKSCCATRPCASSQISCRTNRCKSSASMTQGRAGRLTSQTTCRCSQRPSAHRSSKSDFPEASCCVVALQKGSISLLWRPQKLGQRLWALWLAQLKQPRPAKTEMQAQGTDKYRADVTC